MAAATMGAAAIGSAHPGLTDSAEYVQVYDLVGIRGTSRDRVRRAAALRDAADLLLLRLVRDLRAKGWAWEAIGDEIGMTRQGAQQMVKRNAHRV